MQQSKMTYYSTYIILFGLLAGIIVCSFGIRTYWWLLLILVGALFNTIVQQLGNFQKYSMHRKLEKMMSLQEEVQDAKL